MRTRIASALLLGALLAVPFVPSQGTASTGCVLYLSRLDAIGCSVLASDTGTQADPASLWGSVDCQTSSRQRRFVRGGDRHAMSTGLPQGDDAYRQLTVLDGDRVYGERCELGRNSWTEPTFQNYGEGQRRVTFISLRLPRSFPLGARRWQTVLQMKQSEPSANAGGAPILEVQAQDGRFILLHNWRPLWSTDAGKGVWTRFAFDVSYSQDPSLGSVRVYLDRNRDGDTTDAGERSPTFHVSTLKRETTGGSPEDGIAPGQSIPSHLRVGLYHDPSYRCPPPSGCSVQLDGVEVIDANGAVAQP